MNKNDFLRRLDSELGVLDKEERKELLDFYEERFYSGKIYEHKTEEEIIADLESPEVIARNILAEYGVSPKFVKTKAERYKGIDNTNLIVLVLFDVFVAAWLIPTMFSVVFALFATQLSYLTTFPVILGNPTMDDTYFFILITAVYFLLFMFSLMVLDFSITITKKIFIWHINVLKINNREKIIKKLNKSSIDGFVKKRRKLNLFKKLAIVGAFVAIFVAGGKLLFSDSNYLDALTSNPKTTEYYTEDVTSDIANSESWQIITNFDSMEVELLTVSGNEINVIHSYNQEREFTITLDEETNTVTIANKVDNKFISSFKDFLALIGVRDTITIEIPESLNISDVDINSKNGYVIVKDVNPRSLSISTFNGAVTVRDVIVNNDLDISTLNGRILIENVQGADFELDASTSNGAITIKSSSFKVYNLDTSNGQINLTDLNVLNKDGVTLDADTSNGNINLENVYVLNVNLDTSNGNIDYNNDETFILNSYTKDTSNGNITGNVN
mgnify:CR=1 FL=1|jgi:uncharacterized membrane protein